MQSTKEKELEKFVTGDQRFVISQQQDGETETQAATRTRSHHGVGPVFVAPNAEIKRSVPASEVPKARDLGVTEFYERICNAAPSERPAIHAECITKMRSSATEVLRARQQVDKAAACEELWGESPISDYDGTLRRGTLFATNAFKHCGTWRPNERIELSHVHNLTGEVRCSRNYTTTTVVINHSDIIDFSIPMKREPRFFHGGSKGHYHVDLRDKLAELADDPNASLDKLSMAVGFPRNQLASQTVEETLRNINEYATIARSQGGNLLLRLVKGCVLLQQIRLSGPMQLSRRAYNKSIQFVRSLRDTAENLSDQYATHIWTGQLGDVATDFIVNCADAFPPQDTAAQIAPVFRNLHLPRDGCKIVCLGQPVSSRDDRGQFVTVSEADAIGALLMYANVVNVEKFLEPAYYIASCLMFRDQMPAIVLPKVRSIGDLIHEFRLVNKVHDIHEREFSYDTGVKTAKFMVTLQSAFITELAAYDAPNNQMLKSRHALLSNVVGDEASRHALYGAYEKRTTPGAGQMLAWMDGLTYVNDVRSVAGLKKRFIDFAWINRELECVRGTPSCEVMRVMPHVTAGQVDVETARLMGNVGLWDVENFEYEGKQVTILEQHRDVLPEVGRNEMALVYQGTRREMFEEDEEYDDWITVPLPEEWSDGVLRQSHVNLLSKKPKTALSPKKSYTRKPRTVAPISSRQLKFEEPEKIEKIDAKQREQPREPDEPTVSQSHNSSFTEQIPPVVQATAIEAIQLDVNHDSHNKSVSAHLPSSDSEEEASPAPPSQAEGSSERAWAEVCEDAIVERAQNIAQLRLTRDQSLIMDGRAIEHIVTLRDGVPYYLEVDLNGAAGVGYFAHQVADENYDVNTGAPIIEPRAPLVAQSVIDSSRPKGFSLGLDGCLSRNVRMLRVNTQQPEMRRQIWHGNGVHKVPYVLVTQLIKGRPSRLVQELTADGVGAGDLQMYLRLMEDHHVTPANMIVRCSNGPLAVIICEDAAAARIVLRYTENALIDVEMKNYQLSHEFNRPLMGRATVSMHELLAASLFDPRPENDREFADFMTGETGSIRTGVALTVQSEMRRAFLAYNCLLRNSTCEPPISSYPWCALPPAVWSNNEGSVELAKDFMTALQNLEKHDSSALRCVLAKTDCRQFLITKLVKKRLVDQWSSILRNGVRTQSIAKSMTADLKRNWPNAYVKTSPKGVPISGYKF